MLWAESKMLLHLSGYVGCEVPVYPWAHLELLFLPGLATCDHMTASHSPLVNLNAVICGVDVFLTPHTTHHLCH
jgi:hypothetical protein